MMQFMRVSAHQRLDLPRNRIASFSEWHSAFGAQFANLIVEGHWTAPNRVSDTPTPLHYS
jgi:hypothetical protein